MLANGFRVTVTGEPAMNSGAGRKLPNEISPISPIQKSLARRRYGFVMIVQFHVLRIVRPPIASD